MYQTYNEVHEQSKKHNERNDCAVKALAIACNVPYSQAHDALEAAGRKDHHGTYPHQMYEALEYLGYNKTKIDLTLTGARTMKTAHRACQRGACLVMVNRHTAAMIDGQVIDWTNGRQHRVQSVYLITKKGDAIPFNINGTPAVVNINDGQAVEPKKPAVPTETRKRRGTDRFGSRLGTMSAAINAAMKRGWQSNWDIMVITGADKARVNVHMKWLMERGFVEHSGGYYRLTDNVVTD